MQIMTFFRLTIGTFYIRVNNKAFSVVDCVFDIYIYTKASFIPAIFMISASYAGCDHLLVIVFFIISVGARGFLTAGLYVNPMDLSPNYAAAIMSLANGIGALTGILAPYIVGVLTTNSLLSEWRLVFWITFIADLSKMSIFITWGSGKIQKWN